MHPITQQLTALRLDLVVAQRQGDTDRIITDIRDLLTVLKSIHMRNLELKILDKITFIFLKRKLVQLLNEVAREVQMKLIKELEACQLKLQIIKEQQKELVMNVGIKLN